MARDDLFTAPVETKTEAAAAPAFFKSQPLAARMRPRHLDEYAGQTHMLAPGQLLRRAIEADRIQSLIFYGPPGTGKTSLAQIIARQTKSKFERLSGVESNVADMRRVLSAAANRLENTGQTTILFIDEIHRFNKAQQDVLLRLVEAVDFVNEQDRGLSSVFEAICCCRQNAAHVGHVGFHAAQALEFAFRLSRDDLRE